MCVCCLCCSCCVCDEQPIHRLNHPPPPCPDAPKHHDRVARMRSNATHSSGCSCRNVARTSTIPCSPRPIRFVRQRRQPVNSIKLRWRTRFALFPISLARFCISYRKHATTTLCARPATSSSSLATSFLCLLQRSSRCRRRRVRTNAMQSFPRCRSRRRVAGN